MSFVGSASDWYFTSVPVMISAICYIPGRKLGPTGFSLMLSVKNMHACSLLKHSVSRCMYLISEMPVCFATCTSLMKMWWLSNLSLQEKGFEMDVHVYIIALYKKDIYMYIYINPLGPGDVILLFALLIKLSSTFQAMVICAPVGCVQGAWSCCIPYRNGSNPSTMSSVIFMKVQ